MTFVKLDDVMLKKQDVEVKPAREAWKSRSANDPMEAILKVFFSARLSSQARRSSLEVKHSVQARAWR